MRDYDLGGRDSLEGPEAVGDEALPVVQEHPGQAHFGKILGAVTPEFSEDDAPIDFDESLAMVDDGRWSYIVFIHPFSWQWFINWWVARRYIVPRDVRRR